MYEKRRVTPAHVRVTDPVARGERVSSSYGRPFVSSFSRRVLCLLTLLFHSTLALPVWLHTYWFWASNSESIDRHLSPSRRRLTEPRRTRSRLLP